MVDGVPIVIRGAQRRLLLCLLLADAGRPVPVSRLADALRSGGLGSGSDPANAVHAHMTRLRRLLDPFGTGVRQTWLTSTPGGYTFRPDRLDLWEHQVCLHEASVLGATDVTAAIDALATALDLWQVPFGDLADDPALAPVARELELAHRFAQEQWAGLVVDAGLGTAHADTLLAAAREEPTREQRWALAMRALAQAGRQAEALALYSEARTLLADTLGIDPGPSLRAMEAAILRQDPSLQARPQSPAGPPAYVTRFVGRANELLAVDRAVDRARIVTLTGPAGVGKSRLATQWIHGSGRAGTTSWIDVPSAQRPASGGPDGTAILRAMATQLGLAATESDRDHYLELLIAALPSLPATLAIDNADSGGLEVAAIVAHLVAAVPTLSVLATCRHPLGLSGEVVVPIDALPVPDPEQPVAGTAAELAMLRSDASETRARQIARQGQGVPLAIEILAASPDRRPDAGAAPLAEIIEAALQDLSSDAERVFRRSVVLAGGVSADLAAHLLGDGAPVSGVRSQRAVRELVAASLLVSTPSAAGLRFRTPPSVAHALRVEADQTADAFASVRSFVARHSRASLFDTPVREGVAHLVSEHVTIDTLLAYEERHDVEAALSVVIRLHDVWAHSGRWPQAHELIDRLLASGDHSPYTLARARLALLNGRGLGHMAANAPALDAIETWLVSSGLTDGDAWAALKSQQAVARGWSGDIAAMTTCIAAARAAAAESAWFDALVDQVEGLSCAALGRPVDGIPLTLRSADRMVALGLPFDAAFALHFTLFLAELGGVSDVQPYVDRASQLARASGSPAAWAHIASAAARLAVAREDALAPVAMREAAEALERVGNLRTAAIGRRDLGLMLLRQGLRQAAAHELGIAATRLVGTDQAAAAPAIAGLARMSSGSAAAALAEAAWGLALTGTGTPTTSAQRDIIRDLVGGPPPNPPAAAVAIETVRTVLVAPADASQLA